MADAMVTARMSQEKKEAGNRVLEQLGTNASQVVNRLYDYVLENKKLPFPEEQGRRKYTQEEIAEGRVGSAREMQNRMREKYGLYGQ